MLAAADGYSYLHLIIVAGVIIYAGGVKLLVHHSAGGAMPAAGRLALCGGIALYMLGVAGFGLRLTGRFALGRPLLALALLIVFVVGSGLAAVLLTAIICALTLGMCALETIAGRESQTAG